MPLTTGTHELGPHNASLQIKTYREGVAARVGHDLTIEVTRWEATVTSTEEPPSMTVELSADSRSLEVRGGERGVKPLSDKDRAEIRKNIDEKVLKGQPISFRSSSVQPDGSALAVEGELAIGDATRPVRAQLTLGEDGAISGTIPLTQTEWGIKPYRGLMGALKVRDDVEIVVGAQLPA